MLSVDLNELEMAFEYVSSEVLYEHSAYISRKTGEIYWESDIIAGEEELPEDLGDPEHYISIPHKNDLDLGRRLVMRFVAQRLPEEYDEVEHIFRRRGAYSRYKALLERKGQLEAWYQYEEDETRVALREWSESEGIELVEGEDK